MRSVHRVTVALVLALTVLGLGALPSHAAQWDGRYSVYTKGSFSYQHLDYTCVGASIQMMLNMINGTSHHSADAQHTYWHYSRDRNKHGKNGVGVDPAGWVAGLEHFGAGHYSINVASTYQAGLRQLATAMRTTDRPIGLFVDHGGHAWVMTGFEATADPADGAGFKVTAIQAMGPLYPNGTNYGHSYDPGPGSWLSISQLRKKFTPMSWPKASEWDGRWLAVIPN